jgi:MoaA/NifB/PqqE/SkfB family radical SAM enzyme
MKELTLEITNRCSLNCLHCSTEAGPDGKIFWSAEQIKEILKEYSGFGKIRISGGEPFEHPDLGKILKTIKNENRDIDVLSCGVIYNKPIPEELIKKCKPNLDEIIFSMHGFYEFHNQIACGSEDYLSISARPSYWDILMDSIDNVIRQRAPYSFQMVLMRANFDGLKDIVSTVSCLQRITDYCIPDLHILKFVKQGRGRNIDQELTKEQYAVLPELVEALSQKYNVEMSMSNSFLPEYSGRCDCGSKKAVVTYDFKYIPCSALKENPARGEFACLASHQH